MDLGTVDAITTDAIGEPGMRTFFLQARAGGQLVTVIVEKEQVDLLARSVLELLADIAVETEMPDLDDDAPTLEEPIEPRWRAGRLSIGYDPGTDRFLLEIDSYVPDVEDDDQRPPLEEEPESISLWASRVQMLTLARHGAAVVARGRPRCQFCGNPIDPEGHACPATNGHRKPRRS
jgi:uncharacterized repeat protein (TIGR03847 family)